jgi:hypothetical protein
MGKESLNKAKFSVLVFCMLVNIAYAQTGLFSELPLIPDSFSVEDRAKYDKLLNDSAITEIRLVSVAHLPSVQSGGLLNLAVPGMNCSAQVKAKHVEHGAAGGFLWYGEVQGDGQDTLCLGGSVTLMSKNGALSGAIEIGVDVYELYGLGGGQSLLAKKDFTAARWACGNGMPGSEPPFNGHEESTALSDRQEDCCVIRALALFTPNAAAAVPDIETAIEMTIAQTNQAFRNSLLSRCEALVVLEGIQPLAFAENQFDVFQDRDDLIADMQAPNGDINQRRDAADADIVLVFTGGDYRVVFDGLVFIVQGVAGTLDLEADRALAIIEAGAAVNQFTGAHEIGHLLSARHEPCLGNPFAGPTCDDTGPFEHAHTMNIFNFFRLNTMMFGLAGRRLQAFSTPNVEVFSTPFGIENERDNARRIRGTACTVAAFEDDDSALPFRAYIIGPRFGCPCFWVSLSAGVSGGAGPYQYEWSTSPDGFNWTVQGTGSSFAPVLPCDPGEGIFVRLRSTSADGQLAEAFTYHEAAMTWPGQERPCSQHLSSGPLPNSAKAGGYSAYLYPNPTEGKAYLALQGFSTEMGALIEIQDAHGRIVSSMQTEAWAAGTGIELDISSLPPGLYFVRTLIDGEMLTNKLVKK